MMACSKVCTCMSVHGHETDMPTALRDVRSQGQSGKHLLSSGFSGFDSKRASGLGAVAIATIKSVPLGKV
jgi:hypothetical protein